MGVRIKPEGTENSVSLSSACAPGEAPSPIHLSREAYCTVQLKWPLLGAYGHTEVQLTCGRLQTQHSSCHQSQPHQSALSPPHDNPALESGH